MFTPHFRNQLQMGFSMHFESKKNTDGTFTVSMSGNPHINATAKTESEATGDLQKLIGQKMMSGTISDITQPM